MMKAKIVLLRGIEAGLAKYLESFIPLLGNYEVRRTSGDLDLWAQLNAFEPVMLVWSLGRAKEADQQLLEEIRQKYPEIRILPIDETQTPVDLKALSQKIKRLLPPEETAELRREHARLLVADDEPGINELVTNLLKPLGVEVYPASDGEEALRVFKTQRCNLALVDLRMPKLRGTELVKLLETSQDPPPPRLILLMCAALGANVAEITRLGHPVIPKPMDLEALEEKILEACRQFDLGTRGQVFI